MKGKEIHNEFFHQYYFTMLNFTLNGRGNILKKNKIIRKAFKKSIEYTFIEFYTVIGEKR